MPPEVCARCAPSQDERSDKPQRRNGYQYLYVLPVRIGLACGSGLRLQRRFFSVFDTREEARPQLYRMYAAGGFAGVQGVC